MLCLRPNIAYRVLTSTGFKGDIPGPLAHPRDLGEGSEDHQGLRTGCPAQVHHQRRSRFLRRLVSAVPRHRARLLKAGGRERLQGPACFCEGKRRPCKRRRGAVRRLRHADVCLLPGRCAEGRGC